jgi:hypothetical protein
LRTAILFLVATLTLTLAGCGPRVDVQVSVVDGRVVFDVPWSGTNGLLGFRVEDEAGAVLWDVKMSYDQGHQITYGVLPTGGNMTAQQVVPPDGAAPPEIRGRRIRVRVTYQYDDPAPSAADFEKVLQVP